MAFKQAAISVNPKIDEWIFLTNNGWIRSDTFKN